MPVAVVSADDARGRDARAIASGVSSRQLMQNAGFAAAAAIEKLYRDSDQTGVEIFTGPGNNGGDGWVVAGELARRNIPVRMVEVLPPTTPDAVEARTNATSLNLQGFSGDASVVVDALLGTGSTGAPRGELADAVTSINARERNKVVALDLPTGLDATTGASDNCVSAALTLTFGTMKRGHLISRSVCGAVQVLDIGLGNFGLPGGNDWVLADGDWVSRNIPPISADAHKGTRKRLAIIAGDRGMAGAAILAGKAALRSGIGLLHLIVAEENRSAVHSAVPAALVSTHDELSAGAADLLHSADAIVIGPGLSPGKAEILLGGIQHFAVPMLLDAGALSALNQNPGMLKSLAQVRTLILTPHPAEMGRLAGESTAKVLDRRFEIGADLAAISGATVLLKGTPTIVSDASGRKMVTATGTPALATGGSGDLLSGIIGTLLAQTGKGFESAACGAWIHGRAAEICGSSRGVTLEDVLFAMPAAWRSSHDSFHPPVLAKLPEVV